MSVGLGLVLRERAPRAQVVAVNTDASPGMRLSRRDGRAHLALESAPTIADGIDGAIDGIDEFAGSTLQFTVAVDEVVEIDTDVVIRRTVEVPIKTEIPISQEFDTTIEVDGPFGLTVPFDITVPVDVVVPIDLVVDIPIDETVPVNTSVPINVDVPIEIDVSETDLAPLAESLAEGLRQVQAMLDGISAG